MVQTTYYDTIANNCYPISICW